MLLYKYTEGENEIDVNMTELLVEEGVEYLPESTFSGCVSLTKVTLPGTLICMKKFNFSSCSALKEVVFPSFQEYDREFGRNIEFLNVQEGAFMNCSQLEHMHIPPFVSFGSQVFQGCTKLIEMAGRSTQRAVVAHLNSSEYISSHFADPTLSTLLRFLTITEFKPDEVSYTEPLSELSKQNRIYSEHLREFTTSLEPVSRFCAANNYFSDHLCDLKDSLLQSIRKSMKHNFQAEAIQRMGDFMRYGKYDVLGLILSYLSPPRKPIQITPSRWRLQKCLR